MTTQNRYIYGWEIEGLGDYDLYNQGGIGLRLSIESLPGVTASTSWYARGLADLPKKISTTADVLDGGVSQSTMQLLIDRFDLPDTATVSASDARRGNLAFEFFWGARPKPIANLGEPIVAGTTTFSISLIAGETLPGTEDVIYLGREAMVITAISGSGSTRSITVARGVSATTVEAHELDDTEIFLQNPIKLDRKVALYEYDPDTDTETVRWRGVVEGVSLSDETQVMSVTCRDLMGTLSKRRITRDRWEGNVQIFGVKQSSGNAAGNDGLHVIASDSAQLVDTPPFYPYVDPGTLPGTAFLSADIPVMAVEIEGAAILSLALGSAGAFGVPEPGFVSQYKHARPTNAALDISGTFDGKGSDNVRAKEILICDADSPACYFNTPDGYSDHPAVIMLNLMTSSGTATWTSGGGHQSGDNGDWDWLPGHWGLGIPTAWIDTVAFDNLTKFYPTKGLRARSGYIGAGDGNQSALDVLSDLAQAMNCYLIMNDSAQISIRQLRDPGYGYTDHAIGAENILWLDNDDDGQSITADKPVYAIDMQCAQRGPGGDPGHILSPGDLGQKWLARYRFHAVKDKIESTLIYGDPKSHLLSGSEIEALAACFKWRYIYRQDRLPQYKMKLVHGSALVMPGQWINLSHPYFYDNDTLTRGFVTPHRCLVLEGNWEPSDGTQELTVVDISPATGANTLLSPSWYISSVSSNTVFVISDTQYAPTSGDRSLFVAGATYKIDLWTGAGELRSTSGPVYATAYNSGTGQITLSAAWAAGPSITPAVGNIVRLADYDNATGWQTLAYTFLGDANMQLGAANDSAGRWDV